MNVDVDPEPAEITWDKTGIVVIYGSDVQWWDEKLGRRVRIWGNEE